MFETGKEYRVYVARNGSHVPFEGTLLGVAGDTLAMDIEGVKTFLNLASGNVIYAEEVNAEAEAARQEGRTRVWIDSMA